MRLRPVPMARRMSWMALLIGQVLRAAHRRDLPSLENQDPSGEFGEPALPGLHLVSLGDSSVTAPGVTPLDDCFVRRVAKHLAAQYHVTLISVAVGGAKVADVKMEQVPAAVATGADMAIVSVGGNDALRGTPISQFERDYDQILNELTAAIPLVGVSGVGDLSTIPRLPTLARALARVRSRSVDRAIARAANQHSAVVKSQSWGEAFEPLANEPDRMFAPDLFHGSRDAHALFAAAMIPVAELLLTRRASDISVAPESLE